MSLNSHLIDSEAENSSFEMGFCSNGVCVYRIWTKFLRCDIWNGMSLAFWYPGVFFTFFSCMLLETSCFVKTTVWRKTAGKLPSSIDWKRYSKKTPNFQVRTFFSYDHNSGQRWTLETKWITSVCQLSDSCNSLIFLSALIIRKL